MAEEDERWLSMIYTPLDQMLAELDFLTLHSPMRPETVHQIAVLGLALMEPTALLVNTARGPIVDEAALVRALVERKMAGAGLDVFEREPARGDVQRDSVLQLELTAGFERLSTTRVNTSGRL